MNEKWVKHTWVILVRFEVKLLKQQQWRVMSHGNWHYCSCCPTKRNFWDDHMLLLNSEAIPASSFSQYDRTVRPRTRLKLMEVLIVSVCAKMKFIVGSPKKGVTWSLFRTNEVDHLEWLLPKNLSVDHDGSLRFTKE